MKCVRRRSHKPRQTNRSGDMTTMRRRREQEQESVIRPDWIPADTWAEYGELAKRTHCSTETAILSALNAYLGRV